MLKLINNQSATNIIVVRLPTVGTKAQVAIEYPLAVDILPYNRVSVHMSGEPVYTSRRSSPPLGGKYKIKCVTSAGSVSYT